MNSVVGFPKTRLFRLALLVSVCSCSVSVASSFGTSLPTRLSFSFRQRAPSVAFLQPSFPNVLIHERNDPSSACALRSPHSRTSLTSLAAKKSKEDPKGSRKSSKTSRRKESEIVEDVLAAAKMVGTGFEAADPAAEDSLVKLLEELEDCNEIKNPARSATLWGKWRLMFTNSPPMLKNKGVTGLGSLPFVGFQELTQEFSSDGVAETVEILTMPPFGTPARSTLKGTLTAASAEVIEQTYVDVQLASVFKSQANSVGSDNYFSKAVLAITFLSDALRVCRSPSGAVFLFERVEFSR